MADKWRDCVHHIIRKCKIPDHCVAFVVVVELVVNISDDDFIESNSDCKMEGVHPLSNIISCHNL